MQRAGLLQDLRQLPPLAVRVSAVDDPDARAYAEQLREVLAEAGWPAQGVFVPDDERNATNAGVYVAVRDDIPPDEARHLLHALQRIGIAAQTAHKTGLPDNRTVEILVGLKP
jgi:hypothetical protein